MIPESRINEYVQLSESKSRMIWWKYFNFFVCFIKFNVDDFGLMENLLH